MEASTTTACTPSTEKEYELPCAEALLAGTLALMTAYAQGSPSCHDRPLMAAQLISNLIRLSHDPAFTPSMHAVLNLLCGSWQQQMAGSAPSMPTPCPTPCPTPLWHSTPRAVQ